MQVKYASWSQVQCNLRIRRTLVYVLLSYQLSTYFYRTTKQPIDWVSRHFVIWSDFSESEHSTVLIHSCTKNLSSFWAPKLLVVPLINAQLQCELTLILFFFTNHHSIADLVITAKCTSVYMYWNSNSGRQSSIDSSWFKYNFDSTISRISVDLLRTWNRVKVDCKAYVQTCFMNWYKNSIAWGSYGLFMWAHLTRLAQLLISHLMLLLCLFYKFWCVHAGRQISLVNKICISTVEILATLMKIFLVDWDKMFW